MDDTSGCHLVQHSSEKHCSAFNYMNIQILPFALWRENCESVAKQRWGGKLNPSKPSFAYDFSFHVKKWKKEVNSLQSEINRVHATKGSVRSYPGQRFHALARVGFQQRVIHFAPWQVPFEDTSWLIEVSKTFLAGLASF